MKKVFTYAITLLLFQLVQAQEKPGSTDYIRALKQVTDVMIHDVTSPVAAARYYAYVTLAAHETSASFAPQKGLSFAKTLNKYAGVKTDAVILKNADASLSTIYTVYLMGAKLLPSGFMLKEPGDSLLRAAATKGYNAETIAASKKWSEYMVNALAAYVATDNFRQLSGLTRYTPKTGDAYWQPTGPGYMQALEPNWNTLRTFFLNNAAQFRPVQEAPFDTARNSPYFKQLLEVYQVTKNLSTVQSDIANFWDCNPFALQQIGHVEFGLKKMSPGGHWMGITGIACTKTAKSLQATAMIHALVATTLHDAFVSCWDEKYHSNRVRPETAIRKWIDPRWQPLLQTPPFPEYTSGHSVISAASATILTKIFGGAFSFEDDSEVEFGLPVRSFRSFEEAAAEAAVSRLYGGIHYRDAIDNGVSQGKKVGQYIAGKLGRYLKLVM